MGSCTRFGARPVVAAAWACAFLAWATPHAAAEVGSRVTGSFLASGAGGGYLKATFSCLGLPTCNGIFSAVAQDSGCSNTHSLNDGFTITGLDLSRAGPIGGALILQHEYNSNSPIGGGAINCVYTQASQPLSLPYTGTWNGTTGTIAFSGTDEGGPFQISGSFTADVTAAPPVFPMTITGSITPTVTNIDAQIQYRPQDVGTSGAVFVFALAPASVVKNGAATKSQPLGPIARVLATDDPVPCVLAQVDAQGQLAGVPSASALQPAVSGILGAQGQALSVLSNVPTPNVAGATFFVGYGVDAATMVNSGINRSAVTVPGAVTCVPQPPKTGWWWNPLEGGRGFSIEVQGNNLFFAAFHYEANGRATWSVSPGPTSLGGSFFSSDLYGVAGGQTLGGPYRAAAATKGGAITLAFGDASHGTLTWPGGTVPIERMNLVPGGLAAAPDPNQPETGWWWNPQESGRGFFIEWQKGYADIAGYMYDDAGNPVWYISVYETPNARVFAGNWWTFANGQSMGGTYRAATRTSDNFAPLSIDFNAPGTAVMTLPNGRSTNLVRQRF